MLVIAIVGPILGAIADTGSRKKPFLGRIPRAWRHRDHVPQPTTYVERGDWVLASALALGNLGVAGSFIFYDALLPSRGPTNFDRVSSTGYALGYLGGGILLALNIAWIDLTGSASRKARRFRRASLSCPSRCGGSGSPSRSSRRVPEPRRAFESDEAPGQSAVRTAFTRLGETLKEARSYRQVFLMLLASLVYSDGINRRDPRSVVYGGEIGIAGDEMIVAVLAVQFVGVPCAFGFGGS